MFLKQYAAASSGFTGSLPGAGYFAKIDKFIKANYNIGELYLEYRKGDCRQVDGMLCQFCESTPWKGPEMGRIPRPVPDYRRLPVYQYLPVTHTPVLPNDGEPRLGNDFSPRLKVKEIVNKGRISTNEPDAFYEKYVVKKLYVEEYLSHSVNLNLCQEIRKRE